MFPDAAYEKNTDGIYVPAIPFANSGYDYDPKDFDTLLNVQSKHFWYRGRHRFLRHVLSRVIPPNQRAIDLGAGCGGWIEEIQKHFPNRFRELAIGDFSLKALKYAEQVVSPSVARYQIDLNHLQWENRWDVIFLFDVLEHLRDEAKIMGELVRALAPGGVLLLTVPALEAFWSIHDVVAKHFRRYSKQDLRVLAEQNGLDLMSARYFMFFLSPLIYLHRSRVKDISVTEEMREKVNRSVATPPWPMNSLLNTIFSLESPLGYWFSFPWGSSLLGVFRKPA